MQIVERNDERAMKAKKALEKNSGYCPCKIEKLPKNKCRCREFNMNCMQHGWTGICQCGIYEKVKD